MVVWVDLWRILVAAAALWTALLVTRLAYLRTREFWALVSPYRGNWRGGFNASTHDPFPHPFTLYAMGVTLYAVAVFRFTTIGSPVDARLYVSTVIVVLAAIGITRRTHFTPFGR